MFTHDSPTKKVHMRAVLLALISDRIGLNEFGLSSFFTFFFTLVMQIQLYLIWKSCCTFLIGFYLLCVTLSIRCEDAWGTPMPISKDTITTFSHTVSHKINSQQSFVIIRVIRSE